MNKVYLVGAGPGDPDLITVKGKRLLARADAILYDHLANPALLDIARPEAERIYVGKKRSQHAYSQAEIIELMVERARRGLNVIRLKGGDPFIFGRGGEEVEGLAAAGVAYEIVPGVTAPLGIAAYTGVPLTHREHTSVVTFVTGHDLGAVNWASVAGSETLVIFMGLQHLQEITRELILAGRGPQTAAIAVQWGTRPFQRTVSGTIADIADRVAAEHLMPPATVIIGDVVSLRERLSWYEKLPLFGQQVIVTRAREQSGGVVARLAELAANVIEIPVIEMLPPEDTSELDSCIAQLESYDWLVFTSTNAVGFFTTRLNDVRRMKGRICAVGPATADAVRALRLKVDLTPEVSTGEGIAQAFRTIPVSGARVLFPRAEAAREVVPAALQSLGALVDAPVAYRNAIPRDAEARVQRYIATGGKPDWIVFTSPSTVNNFVALGGAPLFQTARIASIGPATSEAVGKHGFTVTVEPQTTSMDAMVDAIVAASERRAEHHHM
jgi:uroporphyrinogen III methyltransferase/synthase